MTALRLPSMLVCSSLLLMPVACHRSHSSTPSVDTRVRVSLVFDDGSPFDFAGTKVFVDDVQVGTTDADGALAVELPAGATALRALRPGIAAGGRELDGAVTGGVLKVGMIGDLRRPVTMSCPQAQGGTLAPDVAQVELLLQGRDSGLPVAIEDFTVEVEDARADDDPTDVTPFFTRDDVLAGRLSATPGAALVTPLLAYANDVVVRARGHDTDGATFEAEVAFFVEQFPLGVALVAPPSTPGLDVSGCALEARLIGTDVTYVADSDAMGHVAFAAVPRGTYQLFAEVTAGGQVFTASAAQFVNGETSLGLVLLGLPDVLAGVAPTTVWQFAPTTWLRDCALPPWTVPAGVVPGTGVSVSSAAQDQVVTASLTVQFPQDTQRARLVYEVISVEYPTYVLQQSVFNDNWTLRVLAPGGKQLFQRVCNVNSQVTESPQCPQWIVGTSPGTTGQREQEIDVSALTTTGPVDLVVAASATNIGDSQLTTTVLADLLPVAFKVQSITASPVTISTSCGTNTQTQRRQDQFSFPYAPQFNVAQRTLTTRLIGRPEGYAVQSVKVEVRKTDGTVLATVLDEAPAADGRVRLVVGTGADGKPSDDVQIDVTSTAAHVSPFAAAATPPTDLFVFHVLVRAAPAGGATITAERDSPVYGALWKAPLGARTGCRDAGGDDWACAATVTWLQSNASKLGPVNDVSGEHDRNLGHGTHERGKAIDFRQFTTPVFDFGSGMEIYAELADSTYLALNGGEDALADVDAWFVANRTGLQALAADAAVRKIYCADAEPYSLDPGVVLPAGWFVALLKNGTLTAGTLTLTLPSGAWAAPAADQAKVSALQNHLDHYHLALQ
ncbi:MAG: hypothetical protein H6835_01790 [Planctomycetes bacterium]|nr:hypothetical protein [Planctomycetota bacterium]